MVHIAIRALYRSMEYTKEYFSENNGILFIEVIENCYKCANDDIKTIATQCIVELVRFNYDYLPNYMEQIHDITFGLCKNN